MIPTQPPSPAHPTARSPWRALLKLALLAGGLIVGALLLWRTPLGLWLDPSSPISLTATYPRLAPLLLALGLALSITFGLPASALTLLGVTMFSAPVAAAALFLGAMLGASVTFALARGLGREASLWMLSKARDDGRAQRLDRWLTRRGFLAVFYLRLSHIPYGLPGYLAGFSGISWRSYISASALGSIPHIVAFIILGDTLRIALAQRDVWALMSPQGLVSALFFVAVMALPLLWKGPRE